MKNKLAVFDIDGTIFRKNLAFELINELSWLKVFKREVRQELVCFYTSWLDHNGTYEEYRKALVKLYVENIKGCSKKQILEASRIVVPFFKDRTYIFANNLIADLKRKGYHLIAVSGSPIEIVEEYNKYLKFDAVFGTVYELDEKGFYTGKEAFAPTAHKGHMVKQYVAEKKLTLEDSYGVGDTESDAKFLEIVDNPIAFNPNLNLKTIAEEKGWRIVVEKKDVIYEI
ncbi:MAG: HAD-IB family hydrolase [Candidatus Moranbacteria bacterium CG23_combo_of_CG06-09_8_20_14_all_35_22]|nr:MAG: HAD-IB family hydrolase [Candidatus Moranbacteria bacterium CG23_combo_of_CG06-09_8_20_14_all_35_22]